MTDYNLTEEEQRSADRLDSRLYEERFGSPPGPMYSPKYYGPDGGVITFGTWAVLFERRDETRYVAKTDVGNAQVSTVWLGIDHSFGFGDAPLIFETMVFGGRWNEQMWRWPTREAALAGHERIVAALKAGDKPEGCDE